VNDSTTFGEMDWIFSTSHPQIVPSSIPATNSPVLWVYVGCQTMEVGSSWHRNNLGKSSLTKITIVHAKKIIFEQCSYRESSKSIGRVEWGET
jgi:hypothetical protein